MTIDKSNVDEAKKVLKKIGSKKKASLTGKEFVATLINEIHAKMLDGYTLKELWDQVNETLPQTEKMKESSFRRYVQMARDEAGIEPIKKWTRKNDAAIKPDHVKPDKSETQANYKAENKAKTEDDFRSAGGDL